MAIEVKFPLQPIPNTNHGKCVASESHNSILHTKKDTNGCGGIKTLEKHLKILKNTGKNLGKTLWKPGRAWENTKTTPLEYNQQNEYCKTTKNAGVSTVSTPKGPHQRFGASSQSSSQTARHGGHGSSCGLMISFRCTKAKRASGILTGFCLFFA